MYVGRIVAVGRTRSGANTVLYRVSSRSFPNRRIVELNGQLAVVPREGHEADLRKSPYITYNCVRLSPPWAVASNGSQTDPIAEKLAGGTPPRDALSTVLAALDYEKDAYETPRIAALVPEQGDTAWLGIVRRDALIVRSLTLENGRAQFIATYGADGFRESQDSAFDAEDADAAARYLVDGGAFAELEHPVTSAAALAGPGGFTLGTWIV